MDTRRQVSLHDTCSGASPGCSPSDTEIASTDGPSPSISSDAQYVVYRSSSALYLQATCVSALSCSASPSNIASASFGVPAISIGGRFVAYDSALGTINGQSPANVMSFVFDSSNGVPSGGCEAHSADLS